MLDGHLLVDAHVHAARLPTLKPAWHEWVHDFGGGGVLERVYDADGLEKPVAGIVRTEGSKLAAEEIIEFCRDGLPGFKRPRAVLFLDAVPTTATGKVQRFVVREMAKNALKHPH